MTYSVSTYRKLFAIVFLIAFTSAASAAEGCFRGTLDEKYCDRNRDLVADLSLDPKDWINPSTIIFSYTPAEDPALYAKAVGWFR